MKTNLILLLSILILLICNASFAQDEIMKKDDFSLKASLTAIESISNSLETFRDMAEIVFPDDKQEMLGIIEDNGKIEIDKKKLLKLEKSELTWRKLNLANTNKLLLIKGTLLKMEAETNRVKYEISQIKKDQITNKELQQIKSNYIHAKEAFEDFIKSHRWYE